MTATTDTAVRNALATISRPCDVPALFPDMQRMARVLAASKMLPEHLRNDEASIMAVMIAARALDIPMWAAFQGLIVIEGKTGMSAHMMQALVLRAGFGLFPVQSECNAERAVVQCVRPGIGPNGSDIARVEFTLEDAIRADLVQRSADGTLIARSKNGKVLPWEKYLPQLLKRRATSVGARDYYQDVLLGMVYLPDEIGGDIDGDGNPVFRESTRITVSPEVEKFLLQINAADTTAKLRDVWAAVKAAGELDATNLAGETLRDVLNWRAETLRIRDGENRGEPAPTADASPSDEPPVEAEPEPATPTPDPEESLMLGPDRDQLCNVLGDIYDTDWDGVVEIVRNAYGLHPDQVSFARLEELARSGQSDRADRADGAR